MDVRQHSFSRRTLTLATALVGVVSLAIGAHAALNKRPLETVRPVAVEQAQPVKPSARLALIIGNANYPDANQPLAQPVNDARALSAALRNDGFDVDMVEDATRDDINRAVGRLAARVTPDTVVMLFFGGYAVQAGRDSYMLPVDAAIWKEADVRRDGVSVEQVLDAVQEKGAKAKLVVLDGSRRNPYERRFRSFSHGLAAISPPENTLVLTSATPGKVVDDSGRPNSVLVSELLKNLDRESGVEAAFKKTRQAIARASEGEQVPAVASSLLEDIRLGG